MATSEERLEQLKQKYEPALRELEQEHITLIQYLMRGDKLYVRGESSSKEAAQRIEARLAAVNPQWAHEVAVDLRTPGSQSPHTGQTVVQHAEDFQQAASDTEQTS